MPVFENFFQSGAPVLWQWPLKVSIFRNSNYYEPILRYKKWPQALTRFEKINRNQPQLFNILFFLQGPNELQRALTSSLADNIFADVLIVILDNRLPDPYYRDYLLDDLCFRFKAKGVFLVDPNYDMAEWFSKVMIDVSHNNDIVTSLKKNTENGYFFYDNVLRSKTTLTAIIDDLVSTLRSNRLQYEYFNIKSRLTSQTTFFGRELADFLKYHESTFAYLKESGDASTLLEVSGPLYDQFIEQRLEEAKDYIDGRWLIKPPDKMESSAEGPGESGSSGSVDYYNFDGGRYGSEASTAPDELRQYQSAPPGDIPAESMSLPTVGGSGMEPITRNESKNFEAIKEDQARFVQARFVDQKANQPSPSLKPQTDYRIISRIGEKEKLFLDSNTAFPSNIVFDGSNEAFEAVQLVFTSNLSKDSQVQTIELPRTGNSKEVEFAINTGDAVEFNATLSAYHKGRLIQELAIEGAISPGEVNTSDLKMTLVTCLRKDLAELDKRTEFSTSITVDKNEEGSGALRGLNENKSVNVFYSNGLAKVLDAIKDLIEDTVINIDSYPENLNDDLNRVLFVKLALKGNELYVNHLRNELSIDGPMQIITNRQEFVPLDFVYTFPAPDISAKICDNAKAALLQGNCMNCFDKTKTPSDHICPFGFLGFKNIIERHSYQRRKNEGTSDYCIVSEPNSSRDTLEILNNTLYATSQRVEKSVVGLRDQIAEAIKKNASKVFEATDWDNWSVLAKHHEPDSLILIVHVEENKQWEIEQIEIGDKHFLLKNYLNKDKIKATDSDAPPFIIILGCETTEIDNHGFDFSSQLMNSGAAIVLSTFTKIRGRQAGPILIKLIEFLKQQSGNKIPFGEIMLKLRQYFLANGMLVSLALVSQGDADWNIKT